jgi:3-vinyl bacteriochlorophyllide hydratase
MSPSSSPAATAPVPTDGLMPPAVASAAQHAPKRPVPPAVPMTGVTADANPAPVPRAAAPRKRRSARPLYTEEERIRRDRSAWTTVQGVCAALQFLVFLWSCALVIRTLLTGEGVVLANGSVVIKTFTLYTIMVTGAIWEKDVYGQYLFAPAFFWEDVVSMGVIALHTAYLVALFGDYLPTRELMLLALAAYALYAVNAGQFILKLRRARLDRQDELAEIAAAEAAGTHAAHQMTNGVFATEGAR